MFTFRNNKTSTHLLLDLGIKVDLKSGHLFYIENYKPLTLHLDIVLLRHGETFGNCGQTTCDGRIDKDSVTNKLKHKDNRIFQGQVDTEINQLTETGREESREAALALEKFIQTVWRQPPDLILVSPLKRAQETALPFVIRNNFEKRTKLEPNIMEMSFGAWENRRVCDIPSESAAHQFYRDHHALVKCSGINGNKTYQKAENFVDVLIRAAAFIQYLNEHYANKKIILFSHSMFGAAIKILLGQGQRVENANYLAFDGKNSKGEYYTIPHAIPISFPKNGLYSVSSC